MDELLITLRVLINDVLGTTYTDADLQRLIVVSANFVIREVDFTDTYTTSVQNITISPDPTDQQFINLVALKAGILLLKAELRTQANLSVKITDGPSTVDLSGRYQNNATLLKTLEDEYAKAKQEHLLHGDQATRHAISTPTTVEYGYNENYRG